MLLSMMTVMFQQLTLKLVWYSFLTAFFIGVISFLVMLVPVLNIATLSLLITVGFYLADVYWHHKLEGTYDGDTMSQYVIFAIMVVILVLYI
jgi:predicted membrane metal-binding protein